MAVLRRHTRQYYHSLSLLTAIAFLLFGSASAISLGQLGSSEPGSLEEKRGLGPGSWPPTCKSKCGRCWPCKAVHVPIHPGMSTPLEYYPVAWRCQCGNKLFMP